MTSRRAHSATARCALFLLVSTLCYGQNEEAGTETRTVDTAELLQAAVADGVTHIVAEANIRLEELSPVAGKQFHLDVDAGTQSIQGHCGDNQVNSTDTPGVPVTFGQCVVTVTHGFLYVGGNTTELWLHQLYVRLTRSWAEAHSELVDVLHLANEAQARVWATNVTLLGDNLAACRAAFVGSMPASLLLEESHVSGFSAEEGPGLQVWGVAAVTNARFTSNHVARTGAGVVQVRGLGALRMERVAMSTTSGGSIVSTEGSQEGTSGVYTDAKNMEVGTLDSAATLPTLDLSDAPPGRFLMAEDAGLQQIQEEAPAQPDQTGLAGSPDADASPAFGLPSSDPHMIIIISIVGSVVFVIVALVLALVCLWCKVRKTTRKSEQKRPPQRPSPEQQHMDSMGSHPNGQLLPYPDGLRPYPDPPILQQAAHQKALSSRDSGQGQVQHQRLGSRDSGQGPVHHHALNSRDSGYGQIHHQALGSRGSGQGYPTPPSSDQGGRPVVPYGHVDAAEGQAALAQAQAAVGYGPGGRALKRLNGAITYSKVVQASPRFPLPALTNDLTKDLCNALDHLERIDTGLYDRYKVFGHEDRRQGAQGLVQFCQLDGTREEFAVKFFFYLKAYQAEVNMYQDPKVKAVMPECWEFHDNYNREYRLANGFIFPPAIIIERGQSLQEFAEKFKTERITIIQALIVIVHKLKALHAAGWVHRDLKPGNILRMPKTHSWALIDFGCAARSGCQAPVQFSFPYVAPEVVVAVQNGARSTVVEEAVDMFALGVIAFELLTQQRLFPPGTSQQDIMNAMAGRQPLPWEEATPKALARIDKLRKLKSSILQCLSRNASQRPSAKALHKMWTEMFGLTVTAQGTVMANGGWQNLNELKRGI